MAYVVERERSSGLRFTALYKSADGRYRSAGTFDTAERAQEVGDATEAHVRQQLTGTSPADRATITIRQFAAKFLRELVVEPKTKQGYSRSLDAHIIPYIGHLRVADEVTRETVHRLFVVVLKDAGVGRSAILHTRTCLSALMQMARDHGYRDSNPVHGIKLRHPPRKPIVVATREQFLRVHDALPGDAAKLFARLGVASGARFCEMISLIPEDFDFTKHMMSINKSTVEVTREFHPDGGRFVTRDFTKNGERRRLKIDAEVSGMIKDHIMRNSIGSGQLIFPARLLVTVNAQRRKRLTQDEIDAAGWIELANGHRYKHGTMGCYVTAKCRCEPCRQWSADYGRDRKRRKTGRAGREWSPSRRRAPEEYLDESTWRKTWRKAVTAAGLPFRYTPYQIRHTHASWLIGQGVDMERVRARLGHGDLTTLTRYVKILDEEDTVAADVMSSIFGSVARNRS